MTTTCFSAAAAPISVPQSTTCSVTTGTVIRGRGSSGRSESSTCAPTAPSLLGSGTRSVGNSTSMRLTQTRLRKTKYPASTNASSVARATPIRSLLIITFWKLMPKPQSRTARRLPAAVAAKALATVLLIQSSVSMICFEIC